MSDRFDVLCASDMCVDLVLHGGVRPRFQQAEQIVGDYALELGGSANIFACQFAKLGGAAGVIGRVGRDAFGEFALSRLAAAGVDISLVRRSASKTGLGVALCEPDDRAILTYLGTIAEAGLEDLDAGLLRRCRHWHIASYFLLGGLRDAWPQWLSECKAAQITTSLDPNWDPEERWTGVLELLPLVDVFLPNEAEALAVTGENSLAEAGRRLSELCQVVVVKRGSRGAAAFAGGRRYDACAPAVERAVDTVGAGDNFDAGFLRAWLLGRGIEESLELAVRCATSSLAEAGGIEGQLCSGAVPIGGRGTE